MIYPITLLLNIIKNRRRNLPKGLNKINSRVKINHPIKKVSIYKSRPFSLDDKFLNTSLTIAGLLIISGYTAFMTNKLLTVIENKIKKKK